MASAEPAFTTRIEDGVAVLTFDVPGESVNTLSVETGTQFRAALDGALAGIDLIRTARAVEAGKARKLGLVDAVVPAPILLEVARRRALELAAGTLKPDRSAPSAAALLRNLGSRQTWQELALEQNPI